MKESAKSRATFVAVAAIVRPLFNLMMDKKWEGTEKLPAGGFIAAPNHCTEIDPLIIGHLLYNHKRAPHFLAKSGLFNVPVLGWVLRATKQIPVERSTAGANRSLQLAQEIVAEGGAIIIYPEGTLTRDPDLWPMRGKTGAARLALATGAPVVPLAMWGPEKIFDSRRNRVSLRPRIPVTVAAGPPVDLSRWADAPPTKATLEEMTDEIMLRIRDLLAGIRESDPPPLYQRAASRSGAPTEGGVAE